MNDDETTGAYLDTEGYPTREYIFAVCDAIREAGYEPDLVATDVDDGKAWVSVRTHTRETLTLTWKLAEWVEGEDGHQYHVGGPKDPAASASWEVMWFDEDGDYESGSDDSYATSELIPEPAAVVDLVIQAIRDHGADLQTFIAGWEWSAEGQARRAEQAGMRGGGFPFQQDDDTA